MQFRLSGSGCESVARGDVIEVPGRSCVVTRYPQGSLIERSIYHSARSKVACLLLSPAGVTDLLDAPATELPRDAAWLACEDRRELRTIALPLQSGMALAVNDILCCPFRGINRRAYMRAKSVELLSAVIHAFEGTESRSVRPTMHLSAADLQKIALAQAVMLEDLEGSLTLAQLARRVGLNRTKLALGFKQVHGVSVQTFWRDAKLLRARELLRDDAARVTQVALSMGYSELSSFTRAFGRKFGILPRDCRGRAA